MPAAAHACSPGRKISAEGPGLPWPLLRVFLRGETCPLCSHNAAATLAQRQALGALTGPRRDCALSATPSAPASATRSVGKRAA